MALIKFDKNKLTLKVEVGLLEEYKPDREIKRLSKRLETLSKEAADVLQDLTGVEGKNEAQAKLKVDTTIQAKWRDYLAGEFNEELIDILTAVEKKNKEICPGYAKYAETRSKDKGE